MKTTLALTLALLVCSPVLAENHDYGSHVVQLTVTYQSWDEDRPWLKRTPSVVTASAVVVDGQRLLVSARVVTESTLLRVTKHGESRTYYASVAHIDADADLALLNVDDAAFFDDLAPVVLASSLPLEGKLKSVRWKRRQLEIANTRVRRIEVRRTRYGTVEHAALVATTDLSRGGWAEPVFDDGRLVGLTNAQSGDEAYVTPPEIIEAYLRRATSGDAYPGFASIPLVWQTNEDPSLAAYLGLEGEPRGVVVRQIPWGSSACGVIEPRDILLELDGHEIDAIGNYAHPLYGRLQFDHIVVDSHAPGDIVPVRVLRRGEELELEMTLRRYTAAGQLIPWRREETPPPFLVAGGLVFREFDGEYMRTWGKEWTKNAPAPLVARQFLDRQTQTPDRRRIVLLAYVLPAPYNLGYHELSNLLVREVNSRPVDSIADLKEAFAHPEKGFHVVTLAPNPERTEVVLDAAEFAEQTAAIRAAYGVTVGERLAADPPGLGPVCPGSY